MITKIKNDLLWVDSVIMPFGVGIVSGATIGFVSALQAEDWQGPALLMLLLTIIGFCVLEYSHTRSLQNRRRLEKQEFVKTLKAMKRKCRDLDGPEVDKEGVIFVITLFKQLIQNFDDLYKSPNGDFTLIWNDITRLQSPEEMISITLDFIKKTKENPYAHQAEIYIDNFIVLLDKVELNDDWDKGWELFNDNYYDELTKSRLLTFPQEPILNSTGSKGFSG